MQSILKKHRFLGLLILVSISLINARVTWTAPIEKNELTYVQVDISAEFKRNRQLAEKGEAWAQFDLGMMYYMGRGAAPNYKVAMHWFKLAADQGYKKAYYYVGAIYLSDLSGERRTEEGVRWLKLADRHGDIHASIQLGYEYRGLGSFYNNVEYGLEAVRWFKRTADLGNTIGYYYIAEMYQYGEGVPKDVVRAFMWYDIVNHFHVDGSKSRNVFRFQQEELAKSMSARQIAEAKKLVQECVTRNIKDC